ncbi:MAG: hypothetical protein II103_08365 [Treponema sp.]|nr:hypothetical protein [Treponema sp.]
MNEFEKELEGRLALMEEDGYVFPKRFSRRDYIAVAFVAIVCVFGLVAGGILL